MAKLDQARRSIQEARGNQLTELDLSNNQLTELPPEIGQLTQLTELYLHDNQLTELPPEIGQLTHLQELHLDNNQLTELPPVISQVTQLQELYLSGNQLKELPTEIPRLTQLQTLHLGNNQLAELPAEITQLTQLQTLYLSDNQLTELPPEIARLTQLEWLDLDNNRLTELPAQLGKLHKLRKLLLHGNEALNLPPEILGDELHLRNKADPAEILEFYFRSRQEPSRALLEAKILVVGQGAVGKSSLVKRLVEDTFDPEEPQTEGIDIVRWQIPAREPSTQIRVNIWDFGGQEIMHATHEFFLTRRSLYLLVLDARKGENESNLYYWLRIIQTYGMDAPVLVITNKAEPPNGLELNETRLLKDYAPNIRGFFSTSCSEDLGLPELRQAITREIQALEHVYNLVPTSFLATKTALEQRTESEDYLEVRDYEKLCEAHGIEKKSDQRLLLRFLHDLGSVLHFADPDSTFRLEETKILNPQWVTRGVYKILNNNLLMQQGGVLTLRSLAKILTTAEGYPKTERLFILGMMRKFELCLEFADGSGRYLVPELLSPREPELGFDGTDALRFEYHYEVLPPGVIPRFIVRSHDHLTAKTTYWRSGVLLQIDSNRVLVRGDTQEGRVYVAVLGPAAGRRRALTVVRTAFLGIHRTVSRGVEERVALPGYPGESVSYDFLLRLEDKGESTFYPEKVDQRFNVRELLDGIESPGERRRKEPDPRREARAEDRPPARPELFLSYSWGGQSEAIAEEIEKAFAGEGLRLVRDKHDLGFKGSIREFMKRIGKGRGVVLVISDQYLKSKYCMFELVEVFESGDFRERIFPVIVESAKLDEPIDRIRYIKYWRAKKAELNQEIQDLGDLADIQGISDDLDLYDRIADTIARLTDELRDMITLRAEQHRKNDFKELVAAVKVELGV